MEWLAERLRELGVPEKLERERDLQLQEQRLGAEIDTLESRIPLWDRLNVLHLTADEVKRNQLETRRREVRKALAQVDREIEEQLRGLRHESVELGLASQIELCMRQARRDLWLTPPRVKPLAESLKKLAETVLGHYGPELSWDEVLRGLTDEAVCAELAREGESQPREWPAGYPPILSQNLRPLVARELQTGLPPNLRRQAALSETIARLEAELAQVRASISLFDRLNNLETTPAEAREAELREILRASRRELDQLSEEARELAYRSLAAYPPLGIYLRALEARSLLKRLKPGSEQTLGPEGKLIQAPVLEHRHLVMTALKRLHLAYRRAFPALKLPRELLAPLPAPEGPLQAFLDQVERGTAARLRDKVLSHALMLAAVEDESSRARRQVSPVDRLVFWSRTEPEERLARLGWQKTYHERALRQAGAALLQAAREAAHCLLGFRLRDGAQALVEGVAHLHTDVASSKSPRRCPVHNQEHCLRVYRALLELFADYGLTGTYQEFLTRVARATPLELTVEPDPVAGYPPVSPTQLAGMLAFRLQGSDFPNLVANLQELLRAEQALARELDEASGQVTLWDTVNIFTLSPAERRRDELARRRKLLSPDIARLQKEVERLLGRAAESYPPAALYFSLPQVDWALREVRAVCESSRRKSATGRYYTVYRCALKGKSTAELVAQRWAAALIRTYGVLPTYHALLEAWALARF